MRDDGNTTRYQKNTDTLKPQNTQKNNKNQTKNPLYQLHIKLAWPSDRG